MKMCRIEATQPPSPPEPFVEDRRGGPDLFTLVTGSLALVGLTAGVMYFFDPAAGRRRRREVRAQVLGLVHGVGARAGTLTHRLENRSRGWMAAARSTTSGLLGGEAVSDRVLVQRVRSALGRAVSHPHSIQVSADHGRIHLSGPILAREMDRLRNAVADVPGVRDFAHDLEVHETAGNVSGLQD